MTTGIFAFLYLYPPLVCAVASLMVGLILGCRWLSLLLSLMFGVIIAICIMAYDPSSSPLYIVAYPTICYILYQLGAFVRYLIRFLRSRLSNAKGQQKGAAKK